MDNHHASTGSTGALQAAGAEVTVISEDFQALKGVHLKPAKLALYSAQPTRLWNSLDDAKSRSLLVRMCQQRKCMSFDILRATS